MAGEVRPDRLSAGPAGGDTPVPAHCLHDRDPAAARVEGQGCDQHGLGVRTVADFDTHRPGLGQQGHQEGRLRVDHRVRGQLADDQPNVFDQMAQLVVEQSLGDELARARGAAWLRSELRGVRPIRVTHQSPSERPASVVGRSTEQGPGQDRWCVVEPAHKAVVSTLDGRTQSLILSPMAAGRARRQSTASATSVDFTSAVTAAALGQPEVLDGLPRDRGPDRLPALELDLDDGHGLALDDRGDGPCELVGLPNARPFARRDHRRKVPWRSQEPSWSMNSEAGIGRENMG